MKKDIAIIGLGTFGFELAIQLSKAGHSILAIDINEKKVNAIKDYVEMAIVVDITDEDVLKKIEINKFDKVIFGLSSDLESIILAITHMKKLGVKHIIGKANNRIKKEILLKIGADEVNLPEIAAAINLAEKISYPSVLDKFRIDYNTSLIEVKLPDKFVGKSLKELNLRKKYGLNVVMRKNKKETEIITNPDIVFDENDVLFIIGDESRFKELYK